MSADPRTFAGYRSHAVARSTGAVVVVLDGDAAGLDTAGGRWQTTCEKHDEVISHATLAVARSWAAAPEEWCESCMAEVRVVQWLTASSAGREDGVAAYGKDAEGNLIAVRDLEGNVRKAGR